MDAIEKRLIIRRTRCLFIAIKLGSRLLFFGQGFQLWRHWALGRFQRFDHLGCEGFRVSGLFLTGMMSFPSAPMKRTTW